MFHIVRFSPRLILSALVITGIGIAQELPKKPPVLIRDTDVAEGKTDAETAKKKEYSPVKAQADLKVGDYYYKQGNYAAAISRYQEAIEYQPSLVEAFEGLGRTYEKKGDKEKALAVYKSFLKNFPDSPKAQEFQTLCAKLEKKK
jgi:tetratricopeptide (TPR) repeat protein